MRAEFDAAVLADSPWAYWNCQDAGDFPVDSSGNGRDMESKSGTIDYEQTGPMEDFAILLGGGEYVRRTTSAPSATDNFTMMLLAKRVAFNSQDKTITDFANPGANGFGIATIGSGFRYHSHAQALGPQSAGDISDTVFTLVHVVRASGTWIYYIDGEVDTANAGSTGVGAASGRICYLQRDTDVSMQVAGWAVFETALSDERIAAHFAAMTAEPATFIPRVVGLI